MCGLCQGVIAWVGWKFGCIFVLWKKNKNKGKNISDKVSFNCICSMFYFENVNNGKCFHKIMGKVEEVGGFAMFEYYTCSHI